MIQSLIKIFMRDLDAIAFELQAYTNKSIIWKVDKKISNSSGNLTLHVIGNLNHFIGANLGDTGYVRQRNLEFSQKDVPLSELISKLNSTKKMVEGVLSQLSQNDLQKEYRRNPFEDYMTTEYFLLHLKSHLAYHLGQINYHRRLLDA